MPCCIDHEFNEVYFTREALTSQVRFTAFLTNTELKYNKAERSATNIWKFLVLSK